VTLGALLALITLTGWFWPRGAPEHELAEDGA
jgi:hypothetical protein